MVWRRKGFSSFQLNSTKNNSDISVLKELIAQETVHHHTLSLVVTQNEHAAWIAGTILVSTFTLVYLLLKEVHLSGQQMIWSPDVRRREERGILSFSPWF